MALNKYDNFIFWGGIYRSSMLKKAAAVLKNAANRSAEFANKTVDRSAEFANKVVDRSAEFANKTQVAVDNMSNTAAELRNNFGETVQSVKPALGGTISGEPCSFGPTIHLGTIESALKSISRNADSTRASVVANAMPTLNILVSFRSKFVSGSPITKEEYDAFENKIREFSASARAGFAPVADKIDSQLNLLRIHFGFVSGGCIECGAKGGGKRRRSKKSKSKSRSRSKSKSRKQGGSKRKPAKRRRSRSRSKSKSRK
jgi:hypothetical protein